MLSEWHLPPEYILDNWTDELLDLMVSKMVARHKRMNAAMEGKEQFPANGAGEQLVPEVDLFRRAGIVIKVKNSGN